MFDSPAPAWQALALRHGYLKELLRHASATTTEEYYVDGNVQEGAKVVREVTLEVTPTKNELQPEVETRENA